MELQIVNGEHEWPSARVSSLVPSTAGPVDNAQDCLFALVDGRFIY
jgi:hypothetical protein